MRNEDRTTLSIKNKIVWLVGILSISFLIPFTASAQDEDVGEPVVEPIAAIRLDTVTVTARKREEISQRVPITMTALTSELRRPTFRDLRDVNGQSANVRFGSDPSRPNAADVQIRGISGTRTDDNSFDSPIGVMIDGIHLGSLSGQIIENFDIERVEILRGPQGTLFGKNTVGGVVHVIRTRPTGEWGARVKLTGGSFGNFEARAVVNIPAIEDKLALKAFFTHIQEKGHEKNVFLDTRQPKRDYQNLGLTALFTPTDWFEATLTIEKFQDNTQLGAFLHNYNLAPGVAPAPDDPRQQDLSGGTLGCLFGITPCRTSLDIPDNISTNRPNPAKLDVEAITLNTTTELTDNIQIVTVTGYRNLVEDRLYDFDGSSADFIYIDRENDFDQFSQEVRFEGNWDTESLGNISIVAGAYYWESEFTQDWITGGTFWDFVGTLSGYALSTNDWLNPALQAAAEAIHGVGVTPIQACLMRTPLGTTDPIFGNVFCDPTVPLNSQGFGPGFIQKLFETQKTESIAVFAHLDWEVFDGITLTAGIRWTEEKKDFRAGQAYLGPLQTANERNFPGFADLSNKWTDTSPKFGISWQATEDILAYFSYAEGFHSGGFFGVNQNVADFERDQYDPEFSKTYELGLKTQFLQNRVQVNIAGFYNDFKDKQESSIQVDPSTNTVATIFSNVADAVYKGIEVEVTAVLTQGLT
ncbi:MAG: TonB-dependent receptor, partial [Alphaproteobacteria bacterium]|nr:TonB-dependent receptor [Alphaproteobacteria bacterium]